MVDLSTLSIGGGILQGIGSLFGGGKSAQAATKAAEIQAQAAKYAADLQMQMFQQVQTNLNPFLKVGQQAVGALSDNLLGGRPLPGMPQLGIVPTTWGMTKEFTPTMTSLEQTPGYQFTLDQGLKALTNTYGSSGLSGNVIGGKFMPSGPLAAGLTSYSTGLASQTFNQQYQNWLAGQQLQLGEQQQTFNMLGGVAGSGQNAGANLGALGLQTATGAGNFLTSGAAAQAGGIVGAANAFNQGISGATSGLSNALMFAALNNQGMFGTGGGGNVYGTGTGGL